MVLFSQTFSTQEFFCLTIRLSSIRQLRFKVLFCSNAEWLVRRTESVRNLQTHIIHVYWVHVICQQTNIESSGFLLDQMQYRISAARSLLRRQVNEMSDKVRVEVQLYIQHVIMHTDGRVANIIYHRCSLTWVNCPENMLHFTAAHRLTGSKLRPRGQTAAGAAACCWTRDDVSSTSPNDAAAHAAIETTNS